MEHFFDGTKEWTDYSTLIFGNAGIQLTAIQSEVLFGKELMIERLVKSNISLERKLLQV